MTAGGHAKLTEILPIGRDGGPQRSYGPTSFRSTPPRFTLLPKNAFPEVRCIAFNV